MASKARKPNEPSPLRFAVYLRISSDPDGTSTATKRQLKDARDFARIQGWKVVAVFEDVDRSAYREGVLRPQYERMLEALASNEFDGVLVWKLDRLVRRVSEFERFWKVCDESGAVLASVKESIDTTNEIGMLIVRILVAFAQMESANTSMRLKRMEQERAAAGLPKVTGRRPFGLTKDWAHVVPDEAAIIVECADRVLAGESLRSICNDLNARGSTSTGGSPWQTVTLRTLLLQPRLWGERHYVGRRSKSSSKDRNRLAEPAAEAEIIDGTWPAILDKPTGKALETLLTSPGRGAGVFKRRVHLLSGMLRCGKCGAPMRVGKRTSDGGQIYKCPARPEGCNGTAVRMADADAVVSELALRRLNSPEMKRLLQGRQGQGRKDTEILAELASVERRQRDLDKEWAAGTLPMERVKSMQRELDANASQLREQLATMKEEPAGRLLAKNALQSGWGTLSTDQRRAVLDVVMSQVLVLPSPRNRWFEPFRLYPMWQDAESSGVGSFWQEPSADEIATMRTTYGEGRADELIARMAKVRSVAVEQLTAWSQANKRPAFAFQCLGEPRRQPEAS